MTEAKRPGSHGPNAVCRCGHVDGLHGYTTPRMCSQCDCKRFSLKPLPKKKAQP